MSLTAVLALAFAPILTLQAEPPGPRSSHVMSWDPGSRSVVMMGGIGRPEGVWSWTGSRWAFLGEAAEPGSRGHMALAWLPGSGELIVHGGFEAVAGEPVGWDARFGDTWLRSLEGDWRRVTGHDDGPGVRDHHAMATDVARGEVVLFGGGRGPAGESTLLGDTWAWRSGEWHRVATEGPPARATHRLVYDTRRERVVLFGGFGETGLLDDLWEWDGERWTERSPEAGPKPSPRFASRMAYDPGSGLVILFGGRGADGDLADTWAWNGQEGRWVELAVEGPPARNVHGMAYDAEREVVVLYGGFHSPETYSDTWEWNGTAWVQRAES